MATIEEMADVFKTKLTTITFYQACGHKVTHLIAPDPEYRQKWIDYYQARDCEECQKAARAYRYKLTKAGERYLDEVDRDRLSKPRINDHDYPKQA